MKLNHSAIQKRELINSFQLSEIFKLCIAVFIVSLSVVLLTLVYTVYSDKEIYELNNANDKFLEHDYEFSFSNSKKWSETGILETGGQYDCVFVNHTVSTLHDWECIINLPEDSFIDSCWSGKFTMFNGKLYIKPLKYNAEVRAGDPATFGFILHSQKVIDDVDYSISFSRSINVFKLIYFDVFICISVLFFILSAAAFASEWRFYRQQILLNQTFNTIVNIVDSFDEYTYNHSKNVAFYSMELAKKMRLKKKQIMEIYYVALVHDIGKVSIMRDMLNKEGKFTTEERQLIKKHTVAGAETLKDFTAIEQIKDGALYHHERYDGTGYPSGLKGDDIPLFARIICIADSFDVMTSTRCYQEKFPTYEVVNELKACSGTQFDPKIVPYMIEMVKSGEVPVKSMEQQSLR